MAPHSSTLAWKIPWMEEPGRLQSMGLGRVGHDWATSLSFFTFMLWRRKWKPTPCSCLENPRDGGAWWAAVYGVAQSRTRLKRLSSSSSSTCMILFILTFSELSFLTHKNEHIILCDQYVVGKWNELTIRIITSNMYLINIRWYWNKLYLSFTYIAKITLKWTCI